jgi:hypothetical protein
LLEGKHVVVVLIVGGSPAGFAVALAAGTAGIPVLWARGGTGDLMGYTQSVSTIFHLLVNVCVKMRVLFCIFCSFLSLYDGKFTTFYYSLFVIFCTELRVYEMEG